MAIVAQLRPSWNGGNAQFHPSWAESTPSLAIVVIEDIDGGTCAPSKTVITDAEGQSPTIYVDTRDGQQVDVWRQFLFAVENAEGKTPVFEHNRATRNEQITPPASWLPMWTQDFETWHRASAKTLTGTNTAGVIRWQFDEPLPSGRVYVASHATGIQASNATLAQRLLSQYPAIASPTASADVNGVFATSPAEIDDLGRQVGNHPMYAIKLAWGGATTDGGPKRKLAMFANIHSFGEANSWIPFVASIDWMIDNASPEAEALRANWDVYLYFSLSPNGVYAGARRWNVSASRNVDTNRVWNLDPAAIVVEEIRNTAIAVIADTGGSADALFSYHAWNSSTRFFNLFVPPDEENEPRSAAVQAMIDTGITIFGVNPMLASAGPGNLNTDCWWGAAKLGAKVSFDTEFPHNASTDPALYRQAGERWMQTLQAVDAQGLFYTPPANTHTLVVANSTQAQTSPSVAVTQGSATAALGRPASDVSAGSWAPSTGTTLAGVLDEATASDTDYITASGTTPCTIALNPVTTPSAGTTKTVKVRAWSPTSGSVTVELLQNTTVIASWAQALTTSATTYAFNLTSTQAGNITDYSALRVRLTAA